MGFLVIYNEKLIMTSRNHLIVNLAFEQHEDDAKSVVKDNCYAEMTEKNRKIEVSSSQLITSSDENSNILSETKLARFRSTDFFLEEPEGCDWDDGDVAQKNDELPESAQEAGTFLSLDLQQSIDIELISIDDS
ncbi:hypothetical protein HHI36_008410 [Cryptolaemus montrouzieri]|uniref:Uncharacterized protein n=1 Tax=Cryptolaemus montrouzieri TaxID=559131 RepID=A0ABD2MSH8_9CUCU